MFSSQSLVGEQIKFQSESLRIPWNRTKMYEINKVKELLTAFALDSTES